MPYITSGGSIYYGKKQKKNHKKIPNPPDSESKYDERKEKWVKNNEKVEKKLRLKRKARVREPVKTNCGAIIRPFGTAHNALMYNINKGLNSFRIMDDTGAVFTLTAKDAADVDNEIINQINKIIDEV